MAQPKVFVSHSHRDNDFTGRLVADLRAAGADAWVDVADIGSGDFVQRISGALSMAEWVVLVLTTESMQSQWVRSEVNAAINLYHQQTIRGIIFITPKPMDLATLPPLWSVYNRFDASHDYPTALAYLLRAIGLNVAAHPSSAESPQPSSRLFPPEPSNAIRVFVSHSSEDNEFCHDLVNALRDSGADVWYDEHNLGTGILRREIMRELASRPVFLVVLSKAAFASDWVFDECEWAYNVYKRKPEHLLLPVIAAMYDADDFDKLLFLESMKRIEAPGHTPYPRSEAISRTLRMLGLTPVSDWAVSSTLHSVEAAVDLIALGKALNARGNYAKALPLLQRATRLDDSSIEAWANLAFTMNQLHMYRDAITVSEKATALNPRNATVWNEYGVALNGLKQYEAALAAFDKSLTLDPNVTQASVNKSVTLGSLGRADEAESVLENAVLRFQDTTERVLDE